MYSMVRFVASWVIVNSCPRPPRPNPRPPPPPAGAAGAAESSLTHVPAKFGFAWASTPAAIMTTAAALSTAVIRRIYTYSSVKSARRTGAEGCLLLEPEGVNRVQSCRLTCGIEPEEYANRGRKAYGRDDGVVGHDRGHAL